MAQFNFDRSKKALWKRKHEDINGFEKPAPISQYKATKKTFEQAMRIQDRMRQTLRTSPYYRRKEEQ